MMVLEQLNLERQIIVFRITETDVVVKEGVETWLEEEVLARLEKAAKGSPEDVLRWRDKQ